MHRLRRYYGVLIVIGALGGSLIATNVSAALLSGEDHGDAVASAAHTCAHKTASDPDIHGDCVSSVARMNHGHASDTDTSGPDENGAHPANHGADVSQVAQNGPTGTSKDPDAHGDAVSAAAHKHSGH